jgi:DNA-binding protein H-NS
MNKAIKSSEVILKITEKIELKKQLRDARASKDTKEIEKISKKIAKIESKLSSSPLAKS